ncbi:hypothetical protein ACJX0J_011362, partial [Zea mays]
IDDVPVNVFFVFRPIDYGAFWLLKIWNIGIEYSCYFLLSKSTFMFKFEGTPSVVFVYLVGQFSTPHENAAAKLHVSFVNATMNGVAFVSGFAAIFFFFLFAFSKSHRYVILYAASFQSFHALYGESPQGATGGKNLTFSCSLV